MCAHIITFFIILSGIAIFCSGMYLGDKMYFLGGGLIFAAGVVLLTFIPHSTKKDHRNG